MEISQQNYLDQITKDKSRDRERSILNAHK